MKINSEIKKASYSRTDLVLDDSILKIENDDKLNKLIVKGCDFKDYQLMMIKTFTVINITIAISAAITPSIFMLIVEVLAICATICALAFIEAEIFENTKLINKKDPTGNYRDYYHARDSSNSLVIYKYGYESTKLISLRKVKLYSFDSYRIVYSYETSNPILRKMFATTVIKIPSDSSETLDIGSEYKLKTKVYNYPSSSLTTTEIWKVQEG